MKWISVNQELPELNKEVLIYGKKTGYPFIAISYLSEENKWWKWLDQEGCCGVYADFFYEKELEEEITYWQPLPQPPLGDK